MQSVQHWCFIEQHYIPVTCARKVFSLYVGGLYSECMPLFTRTTCTFKLQQAHPDHTHLSWVVNVGTRRQQSNDSKLECRPTIPGYAIRLLQAYKQTPPTPMGENYMDTMDITSSQLTLVLTLITGPQRRKRETLYSSIRSIPARALYEYIRI